MVWSKSLVIKYHGSAETRQNRCKHECRREAKENAKLLDAAVADMELITGQKAVTTKAKNSIANFKIREGMPISCKVTLRGEKNV